MLAPHRTARLLPLALLLLPASASATAGDEPPFYQPLVVLYTIGQGEDVFESFGHTSLCLRQRTAPEGDGLCFDYGTADFDDIGKTGWLFLRGKGSFRLSTDRERKAFSEYVAEDRTIWRQILPLTPEQAEAVRLELFRDARDPGWRYAYRLTDDNCSTRIRDILDRALGGRLRAGAAGRTDSGLTFRDYGHRGFAQVPIANLLLDLYLGRAADEVIDRWQAMFLPLKLRDGVRDVLGAEPELVYDRRGPAFSADPGWSGRGWLFLLAALAALPLAAALRFGRWIEPAVAWAVLPLVLLGALVWFTALAAPFFEVRVNELLMIFVPWDVVLPFLGAAARRHYARARVILLAAVSLLAVVGVFHQTILLAAALAAFAPFAVLAFQRTQPAR
jgi:hypothetical protein